MGLEDKQVLIGGGVVAFFGIAVVISLLIFPSFAGKDTQFFITNTVNSTSSNALANLTDVSLINLQNSQILVYNFTALKWENENATSFSDTTVCNNLGSGFVICPSYSSGNVNIRTLLAGLGITLSNSSNSITITNAGVLHTIAGTGISVNQTSGSVLITNTLPESTVCNNATSSAGHKGLCKDSVIDLRTLLAGSGISLSLNSTDITITNSGVTSITANSPLSASASTGSITLSCSTCITSESITEICQGASTTTSISCSSFTGYEYLKFYIWWKTSATGTAMTLNLQFNSDSSGNYAYRNSDNGGADGTGVSQTRIDVTGNMACSSNGGQGCFLECVVHNISSERKLGMCLESSSIDTSSATAPNRKELDFKWDNTSNQITTIALSRSSGTATFAGGEITVFGWN